MKDTNKVIGFRETVRMIKQGNVSAVTMAKDTDKELQDQIKRLCDQNEIALDFVKSKRKLGASYGIERPAAVVASLKNND